MFIPYEMLRRGDAVTTIGACGLKRGIVCDFWKDCGFDRVSIVWELDALVSVYSASDISELELQFASRPWPRFAVTICRASLRRSFWRALFLRTRGALATIPGDLSQVAIDILYH